MQGMSVGREALPLRLRLRLRQLAVGRVTAAEVSSEADLARVLGCKVPDGGFPDVVSACLSRGYDVLSVADASGTVLYARDGTAQASPRGEAAGRDGWLKFAAGARGELAESVPPPPRAAAHRRLRFWRAVCCLGAAACAAAALLAVMRVHSRMTAQPRPAWASLSVPSAGPAPEKAAADVLSRHPVALRHEMSPLKAVPASGHAPEGRQVYQAVPAEVSPSEPLPPPGIVLVPSGGARPDTPSDGATADGPASGILRAFLYRPAFRGAPAAHGE